MCSISVWNDIIIIIIIRSHITVFHFALTHSLTLMPILRYTDRSVLSLLLLPWHYVTRWCVRWRRYPFIWWNLFCSFRCAFPVRVRASWIATHNSIQFLSHACMHARGSPFGGGRQCGYSLHTIHICLTVSKLKDDGGHHPLCFVMMTSIKSHRTHSLFLL